MRRRGQTPSGGRAIAGSALRVLGIALVIAALFVAWYSVSSTGEEVVGGTPLATTGSLTFYPLNQFSFKLTCQGSSSCFSNLSGTEAYPQGTFDSIGTLYDIVAGLVIGGIVLSALAMLLAFMGGRRRSGWAGTLALVAILVLVAAPVLLAVAQPSVLSSSGGSPTGGSSPDTSFFGSCSGSGCGSSMTPGETVNESWGPSAGWYLCLVGVAFLLAGLIVGRGQRNGARPPSVYDLVR